MSKLIYIGLHCDPVGALMYYEATPFAGEVDYTETIGENVLNLKGCMTALTSYVRFYVFKINFKSVSICHYFDISEFWNHRSEIL